MRPRNSPSLEDAEIIGLKALTFLAGDESRLARFLALTGMSATELRARAGATSTLRAVLEHLAGDESLLLVFTTEESLQPEAIGPALHALTEAEGP